MTEHINIGKGKVAFVLSVAEGDDPLQAVSDWANEQWDQREKQAAEMHPNWVRIKSFAGIPGWVQWMTDGLLVLRVNVPRWSFTKPTHYWNDHSAGDKQPPLLRGL